MHSYYYLDMIQYIYCIVILHLQCLVFVLYPTAYGLCVLFELPKIINIQ